MKLLKKTLLAVTALCAVGCVAGAMGASCGGDSGSGHTHSWDEGQITTPATCETAGLKTFTCTDADCDETKNETVAALGHDWDEWDVTPATCTVDGSKTRTCKNDENHTQNETLHAAGHKWSEWSVVASTDDSEGVASKTCENDGCEEYETVDLPVLTSNVYNVTDSADCTNGGNVTYKFVTDGGENILVKEVYSPAKGHKYGEAQFNAADGDNKANVTFKCADCDHEDVTEYDEASITNGIVSNGVAGKAYYLHNELAASETASKSIGVALSNFVLQKGSYEFDFKYVDNKSYSISMSRTTLQVAGFGAIFDTNNNVKPAFENILTAEFTEGRLTKVNLTVDGTTVPAESKINFSFLVNSEPGDSIGVIVSTKFTEDRTLKAGANSINVTDTYAFVDTYTFVSDTDKTYSLTVPEGMDVAIGEMHDDILIDSVSGTWANFNAKAGEPVVFTFSYTAKGTYTVTIGDEVAIPKLAVGADPLAVGLYTASVTELGLADGLTEGTYTVTFTGSFLTNRSAGAGGFYFMVNRADSPVEVDYAAIQSSGIYMSGFQQGTKDGCAYNCVGNSWTVTATLKAGDTLCFGALPVSGGGTVGAHIGDVYVALSAAA